MTLLERILATKREEVAALARARLPTPPARRALDLAPGGPVALWCEIKHRSPSAGALSTALDVAARAAAYERAGAAVISVLCDTTYFAGSFAHLAEARSGSALPLLCKDFIISEAQLDAARAYGADLALLIVRCLEPERVEQLVTAARERELVPLVEVVSEAEADVAVAAGADVIGVNARDLDTLALDAERSARVLRGLPEGAFRLHLSGVATSEAAARVAQSPADGALVGEALMRQDDPEPLLRRLLAATRQ